MRRTINRISCVIRSRRRGRKKIIYLVSTGSSCMTQAAFTFHKAISQERVMRRTVGLFSLSLLDETILPQLSKDLLDDFCVLGSRSATKDVEIDLEPSIDIAMNGIVLGAEGGRIYTFSKGLGLGGRAIFVCAANIQRREAACSRVTGKHICGLLRSVH